MAEVKPTDKVKAFFSTPEKPLLSRELIDLRRADKEGYDEIVRDAVKYVDSHPDEFPELFAR